MRGLLIAACLLSTPAGAQVRTSTSTPDSPPITKDALLPGDPGRPDWPADNPTMFVVIEMRGQPATPVYVNVGTLERDADWSSSKLLIKWWTKVAGAYFGKWTVRQYPYKTSGTLRMTEPVLSGFTLGYTKLATFGQDFIIDFAQYAVNDSGKEYWLQIQPFDKDKRPLAPASHAMIIRFVTIPR